ncbi:hypothetical protein TCON_2562 [Astathelohania contejeani]|uniref:Uncharacterized protein n=1 Tax=Astathelohania contejeani TaxID=164912 RepID=A0ABQ7HVP0_9MICR|nr:hypothetical protein TCON_2562 [Thelohania contejeani]
MDFFKKDKKQVSTEDNLEKVRQHINTLTKQNEQIAEDLKVLKDNSIGNNTIIAGKIQEYKRNLASLDRLRKIENNYLEMELMALENEAMREMEKCASIVSKKMKKINIDKMDEDTNLIFETKATVDELRELMGDSYISNAMYLDDNISDELDCIMAMEQNKSKYKEK